MRLSKIFILLFTGAVCISTTSMASEVQSFTVEGGPIASKHFQSGDNHFRERHMIAAAKVSTENYGNWGLYLLTPNSVRDTSVGFGYVTDPYIIPIGPTALELNGVIGLVTGYQDYPVPLLGGQARMTVYESGVWNTGLTMAILPYIAEDDVTGKNKAGIVATTPFLSVRYSFN